MDNLNRILFIHGKFYEYSTKIAEKMREQGYYVDCYCDDNDYNIFEKIIYKAYPQYIRWKLIRRQKKMLSQIRQRKIQYDYVFALKGEYTEQSVLEELKALNPHAHFILYLWDEVERVKNFHQNQSCYEKIYSFSEEDSERYHLHFLPLFFCDEYRFGPHNSKEIDVFLSAGDHADRIAVIEKLLPIIHDGLLKTEIYLFVGPTKTLQHKILVWLGLIKEPYYMKYTPLSHESNACLSKKSNILIDIQYPGQKGLTMRSIESLATKSKLITTNPAIMRYDFFRPENICVIDRDQPVINQQFLFTPYVDISEQIIEQYSLSNWVKTILNIQVQTTE